MTFGDGEWRRGDQARISSDHGTSLPKATRKYATRLMNASEGSVRYRLPSAGESTTAQDTSSGTECHVPKAGRAYAQSFIGRHRFDRPPPVPE